MSLCNELQGFSTRNKFILERLYIQCYAAWQHRREEIFFISTAIFYLVDSYVRIIGNIALEIFYFKPRMRYLQVGSFIKFF